MEYIIYLSFFLIAGFVFGKIILKPKKSDLDYKIAMAKAQLEWMKTDDYKQWQEDMQSLYFKPELERPIHFGQSYWTNSEKEGEENEIKSE